MRNRSNLLFWIGGAAIIAVVLAHYFQGGGSQAAGPAALQGKIGPSFSVAGLNGGVSALDAYRGHVVVMNLWASWCPPCRAEMPDLQRLYQAYKTRNLVVLGIDQGESAERVGQFAQSLGIHYPILLDQQQQYGRVYAALGLPTTILINGDGVVIRGFDGPLSYQQMVAAVTPLMGK